MANGLFFLEQLREQLGVDPGYLGFFEPLGPHYFRDVEARPADSVTEPKFGTVLAFSTVPAFGTNK